MRLLCALSMACDGMDARNYAQDALSLAEKKGFARGQVQANILLGKYYYFNEEFSHSLEHCMRAFDLAKKSGDNRSSAIACRYIGYNNFRNAPTTAMEFYKKSVDYSVLAKDELLESYALSAIGNLYESLMDGKNALEYYSKSLEIRKRVGNTDEQVSSLIETARAYNRLSQYDRSMELVMEAKKVGEEKGADPQNLVYIYQMIGYDLADRQKDYSNALGYFLHSYNLARNIHPMTRDNINSLKPV
ncbi:MAG TPA: tetratricopeptide repeat protein, partial [Bacteroidia bacterium]